MNPKVISEEPINSSVLKAELERIRKRDGDLNIRSTKTEEYLKQSVVLKKKESEELFKKITDMDVPRIKEIHVHKIIDLMPVSVEELKSLLSGYTISLSQDNLKKIMDAVSEYSGKKN